MLNNKKSLTIVINALVWAAAILMVAWFAKGAVDEDTSFMMTVFLVAGWFTTNGLISEDRLTIKEKLACVKRFFRIGK